MQIALLILGGLLAGLYFYERWSTRATPAQRARAMRKLLLAVAGGALLLLVLRAAPALLLPLLPLLVPILLRSGVGTRWRPAGGGFGSSRTRPRSGSRSEVVTRFLRMSLDHASGAMTGTVLEGVHSGRSLDELTLEQLLDVWRACQVDPQSAAVLEAYLDRTQASDWRERAAGGTRGGNPARNPPMDRQEAYAILGLEPGAGPEEIKAAHRRLMQKLHPDHGGSDWLAARINQAKDLLLGD